MKAWEKGGSYCRKGCLRLFYSHKVSRYTRFNLEASDSRSEALRVYRTFAHVTSLHLTLNLRVSVILSAESGSQFQIFLQPHFSYLPAGDRTFLSVRQIPPFLEEVNDSPRSINFPSPFFLSRKCCQESLLLSFHLRPNVSLEFSTSGKSQLFCGQ